MKKIIPAILTKDIAELRSKLTQIQKLTDWAQIDIMDGKFVQNISIGLEDVSLVKIPEGIFLEAHLMVENPASYFTQCQQANIKRVIFHIEMDSDIKNVLLKAKSFNFQKGLALNPETPVEKIIPYINDIDVALLMSVHPGFGGQTFILNTLDKIRSLKKLVPHLKIEVDGGVNIDNIKAISDAGADYFIVGSGLFEAEDSKKQFENLQMKIK